MLHFLSEALSFPPVNEAMDDGLLAVGGDLSTERLLLAYRNGIFPWFNEEEELPLWWCPDPRFVLFPGELRVTKSMKQVMKNRNFQFSTDTSFHTVINHCRQVPRGGQDGTWISNDIIDAYTQLHKLGHAHSAETWEEGNLVGGLYGIRLGNVFFGESMFSLKPNASKFAFINYVQQLRDEGIVIIDCQVYTQHLESLGARMIARTDFMDILQKNVG